MIIKRRPFTLLEMLISLTLTALILSCLMFFFYQVSWLNQKYDRLQQTSFQRRFLENRLSNILPRAVKENTSKKDFYFFTTSDVHGMFKNNTPTLIFTFDNGVDLDKNFSNHVLGRFYLDPVGNLTLAMWPSPKRWEEGDLPPLKKQILMQNVDNLAFRFFIPQESETLKRYKNDREEPFPRLSWIETWKQEYKQLPAILQVIIEYRVNGEQKEEVFAYPLPHVFTPIIYKH